MKKYIALILTLVMALGICTSAIAIPSPMGKTQDGVYSLIPPYTDYRMTGGILGDSTLKPTAGFKIQVGTETPIESPLSNGLDVQTPSLTFSSSSVVSILPNSLSTDGTSRTIDKYDFQYRIVAEGQDRLSQPIHATDYPYYRSWSAVETAFATAVAETKALNTNAELELYLCVADGGDDNWSSNGNSAVSKVDSNFPNGIIWYFSGMVLQYKTGGPDFYPLPWGATEYNEYFKTCAMTYTGNAGEAMNIPVRICNSGSTGITNMKATWFGAGWTAPVFSQDTLNIDQGQYQDFLIPVTVPQPGEETRLVVVVNRDGQHPSNEVDTDNNLIIIKVMPPGVDVAIELHTPMNNYTTMGNGYIAPSVTATITRLDDYPGTEPVIVTLIASNGQTVSKTVSVSKALDQEVDITFDETPGSYTVHGEAWPTTQTDTDIDNNTDDIDFSVTLLETPTYVPSGTKIKTGLGG